MSLSFAKAGASQIAIAARSDMATLEKEMQEAAASAGKPSPAVLRVKLDVASRESIDSAASGVEKEFGKLDILVNNAGIVGNILPVADSDPDDWWNTWTVNVRGPYLMTRAFLPLMLQGGDKQIVNVSSVGAHLLNQGLSSYQSSKLALLRFTEFVSAEYSDKGLVTFCIHPGNVLTDMINGPDSQVSEEVKHSMYSSESLSSVLCADSKQSLLRRQSFQQIRLSFWHRRDAPGSMVDILIVLGICRS